MSCDLSLGEVDRTMTAPIIHVTDLTKRFRTPRRFDGKWGAVRTLVTRQYDEHVAVDRLSFQIHPGEMVGYVGPNGAGKSTTIKMLTGILVPTSGIVEVAGLIPHKNRKQNAKGIGVMFGQRRQLWWDLPVIDSFRLHRDLYRLPSHSFNKTLERTVEMLEIGNLLQKATRQLSLGQRMRAELAMALLHEPPILYLDEPTIGLDVVVKERIRNFLVEENRRRGLTVLLTTHDLADVEKVCQRMMMIHHGRIVYDGSVQSVRAQFGTTKTLVVDLEAAVPPLHIPHAAVVRTEANRQWLRFDQRQITAVDLLGLVTVQAKVIDMSIEEPEIEEIVRQMYLGKQAEPSGTSSTAELVAGDEGYRP